MTAVTDPVLEAARNEIAALDLRILSIVNERIRKVAALRRYKTEAGLPLIDPTREAWLHEYLKRLNEGPLSDVGVDELVSFVLMLVRREAARA